MNRSITLVGNQATSAQGLTLQLINLDHATTLVRNGAVHLHVDSYGPDNTVAHPDAGARRGLHGERQCPDGGAALR